MPTVTIPLHHDASGHHAGHGNQAPKRRSGFDNNWIFELWALLYADDTTLLASSTDRMEKLLHALETVAARYGLRLNQNKCVWMASGLHGTLKFKDDSRVARVNEATYLGSKLNIFSDQKKELHGRIAYARVTWVKLAPFWKYSNCPAKIKLRILDAVIAAKLLYSTASMWLSDGDCKKVDAFFFKTIRQILKVKSTYKDRTKTNEFLLKKQTEGSTSKKEKVRKRNSAPSANSGNKKETDCSDT